MSSEANPSTEAATPKHYSRAVYIAIAVVLVALIGRWIAIF